MDWTEIEFVDCPICKGDEDCPLCHGEGTIDEFTMREYRNEQAADR